MKSSPSSNKRKMKVSPPIAGKSDVTDIPLLPPTRASRGGVKEPLEDINGIPSRRSTFDVEGQRRNAPRFMDSSTDASSVKLYLSAASSASASSSSHQNGKAPHQGSGVSQRSDTEYSYTSSTTVGSQWKGSYSEEGSNAGISTQTLAEKPMNTGAFAMPGPRSRNEQARMIGVEGSTISTLTGPSLEEMSHAADGSAVVRAEIVPDLEELVQKRLQVLQEERDRSMVIAVATPTDEGSQSDVRSVIETDPNDTDDPLPWSLQKKMCLVTGVFVLIAVAAGAASGIMFASSSGVEPVSRAPMTAPPMSPTVTTVPTDSPSVGPTSTREAMIVASLLGDGTNGDDYAMDPANSPEAFNWLLNDDDWEPPQWSTDPEGLLRERYALVAFYFAMKGDFGFEQEHWLSPGVSVCSWECCGDDNPEAVMTVECNRDGKVIEFDSSKFDLVSGSAGC